MVTHRIERLQEEIRHNVTQILLFEIQDPRVRELTITRVVLSRDMGFARIYYETTKPELRLMVKEGLEQASGFVRKSLGRHLKLRITPQLEFFYDETSEAIQKVEELFSKL